jgi:hypothetical protein
MYSQIKSPPQRGGFRWGLISKSAVDIILYKPQRKLEMDYLHSFRNFF